MTGWLILTIYVSGWLLASRKAAIWSRDEFDSDDASGRVLDRLLGAAIGLLWPLLLVLLAVTWRLPKTQAERERELDARERHIAELERDLGIGR